MADEGIGSRNVLAKPAGGDFVEVMFATSLDEAKECCHLLDEVQIPSRFSDDQDGDRGIAVLVPEDRLIEASELLAARVQHDSVDEQNADVCDEDDVDDADTADDDDEFEDDDDDDDDDDADDDEEDDTDEDNEY